MCKIWLPQTFITYSFKTYQEIFFPLFFAIHQSSGLSGKIFMKRQVIAYRIFERKFHRFFASISHSKVILHVQSIFFNGCNVQLISICLYKVVMQIVWANISHWTSICNANLHPPKKWFKYIVCCLVILWDSSNSLILIIV